FGPGREATFGAPGARARSAACAGAAGSVPAARPVANSLLLSSFTETDALGAWALALASSQPAAITRNTASPTEPTVLNPSGNRPSGRRIDTTPQHSASATRHTTPYHTPERNCLTGSRAASASRAFSSAVWRAVSAALVAAAIGASF